MTSRTGAAHKAVADDAMSLQYGHRPPCVMVVVVLKLSFTRSFPVFPGVSNLDEVVVGHALLLFDHDGYLDDFPEACRVCIARLEMFRYHDELSLWMYRRL